MYYKEDTDFDSELVNFVNNPHFVFTLNHCSTILCIPKNYKEAIASPQNQQWRKVMRVEMSSLEANHTYDLVTPQHGINYKLSHCIHGTCNGIL